MSLVKLRAKQPVRHSAVWDEFFNRDLFDSSNARVAGNTVPAVNVKEGDNEYGIELAAPGFTKSDFELNLDQNVLTVSGKMKSSDELEDNQGKYTRKEFSYSNFKRSFTLPETANKNDITAAYKDGILKVLIPKKEEAKAQPARSIKIK